ncbi:WD40 repeat domain-containing protein [Methanoregula sp. UBA64]|jgi:outer membrane protein assembly factor BamB|uniref:WD40 repeat domain-containing protein n=1 Tax=Methanoregula sp. UBA64 TaxID=1915554 RepID=UPI0025ED580C|nr:PQQ-binding-like beta-propeller repeat protein [Methanoregula sp. UBA64]
MIQGKKISTASQFLLALMALCLLCVPALAVQPQWTFALSPNATYEGNLNKVTISDDGQYLAAYVADENSLLYFNRTGALLWSRQFTAERPPWISSISIARDNSIIAASELVPGCCAGSVTSTTSNHVIIFDRTGAILWNYSTMSPPVAVAISPDASQIYVGTEERRVICLDRNGSVLWTGGTDAPVHSLTISKDGTLIAAAGTNPGTTPQGTVSYPNDLFLFDRNGSPLWKYRTGGPDTVAISGDNAIIAVVGGRYGNLYLFNRTGGLVGERSFPETGSSLAISDDASRIVVGSVEGSVYGLDNHGTILWTIKTSRLSRNIAIDETGDYVVFGNGSSITTVDRNGSALRNYPTGAGVSSVAVSGNGNATGAIADAVYFFGSLYPESSANVSITIDPVADHYVGDSFVVHGTANVPSGEEILVDILPSSPENARGFLMSDARKLGMSETVIVQPGKNSPGEWSCPVHTAGWVPLTYRVRVTPVNPDYGEPVSTQFNLTERQSPKPTIPARNTTASPALLQNMSQGTTAAIGNPPREIPTTHPASLPLAVSLAAAGLGALASRRYRKE